MFLVDYREMKPDTTQSGLVVIAARTDQQCINLLLESNDYWPDFPQENALSAVCAAKRYALRDTYEPGVIAVHIT